LWNECFVDSTFNFLRFHSNRIAKCYAALDYTEELKQGRPKVKDAALANQRWQLRNEKTTRREAEDVAVLFTLGFFNRPTFLFFALPALVAFGLKDRNLKTASLWDAFGRMFLLIPAAGSFMVMISVLDTLFYKSVELRKLPRSLSYVSHQIKVRFF
jgi:hypothetical protein